MSEVYQSRGRVLLTMPYDERVQQESYNGEAYYFSGTFYDCFLTGFLIQNTRSSKQTKVFNSFPAIDGIFRHL